MARKKPLKPLIPRKSLPKPLKSIPNSQSNRNSPKKPAKNPKEKREPSNSLTPNNKAAAAAEKKPARNQKEVKKKATNKPARNPEEKRASNAQRSSYFARREAAKVLRTALQGDANRSAVGSIKSLVYSPSIRNKKATFALVCQTLKHLSTIKNVLEEASALSAKWKKQDILMYIITYDILFGKEDSLMGEAEKYLILKKEMLLASLSGILKRMGLKTVEDLVALDKTSDFQKPRYVRVNTLKIDTESAISELRQQCEGHGKASTVDANINFGDENIAFNQEEPTYTLCIKRINMEIMSKVQEDDMVPDLLVLPPGADLHNHPLVINRSVFMQGKASSMAAVALGPKPGWDVIDACSAPGNKTLHLAALMKGKGKVIACELNKDRFNRLKDNVKLAGATNVRVKHGDFLKLDVQDPSYSKVRAILLDPSCSGSGTAFDRLDHLLPSHGADPVDEERLRKLAGFQKKVLEHAFLFPAVERIVYSTCSIHQIENEDVVQSVLDLASSHGFELETAFPQWPRRGLPTFDGSQHLVRTHLEEDKEGFFIALFVKKSNHLEEEEEDRETEAPEHTETEAEEEDRGTEVEKHTFTKRTKRSRRPLNYFVAKMLKLR